MNIGLAVLRYCVFTSACCIGLAVAAQDVPPPDEEKPPVKPAPAEKPASAKPMKDPTAVSPKMKQILKPESRAEVVEVAPVVKLPEMSLKAIVKTGESALAMIEVKGTGLLQLREGEEFSVQVERTTISLKVKKMTADVVEIESADLKQVVILR